jgi:pyruvate dehydrogenase E1 component alpha subunit
MAITRIAQPVATLDDARACGLDRVDLVELYRLMVLTRGIEERGHILFRQGKVPGSFYTGRGNEAAAVGVGFSMERDDVGFPIQRDMGVHVARGTEPWRVFAQYMGRVDGFTAGRDGNVHMADTRLGLVAMVSHLPANVPVACGAALAFRIRGEARVAVGWSGDGATSRSDWHEALNFAGVRRLPVVFIVDNNQFAYSTPNDLEYATEHIADRAAGYGFEGVVVDGTDVVAVVREARAALALARSGGGPTLLELVTLRMEGHAVHDDAYYMPKGLHDAWSQRDPLERYRAFLREHLAEFDEETEMRVRADVKAELAEALRRADASPLPDPATLLDGLFADPGELDTPHHR